MLETMLKALAQNGSISGVAFLALLLLVAPASTRAADGDDDHLLPGHSVLHDDYNVDYDWTVRQVLSKSVDSPQLLMLSIPSFEPEYSVAVTQVGNSYFVTFSRARLHLWLYQWYEHVASGGVRKLGPDGKWVTAMDEKLEARMAAYPEDPLDVELEVHDAEIDLDTYNLLQRTWAQMLVRTRFPALPQTCAPWEEPQDEQEVCELVVKSDGVTHHFSMRNPDMSGWVWSPEENTSTGRLVTLAQELARMTTAEERDVRRHLRKARRLANRILADLD